MTTINWKRLLIRAGCNFAYSFFVTATAIISVDSIAKTGMTVGQLILTAIIVGVVQGGLAASKIFKDETERQNGINAETRVLLRGKKTSRKKAGMFLSILRTVHIV